MMADLTLAALHFILIFALVGILGAEAALVREGMDGTHANRVAVLDRGYGAAAALLLVAGFLRVFYGAKGAAFMLIATLSIPPTVRFIAWQRHARKESGFRPADTDVRGVRRLIIAQAAV